MIYVIGGLVVVLIVAGLFLPVELLPDVEELSGWEDE